MSASNDFYKVLVKDSRLNCRSTLGYAVFKGGMNVTNQPFNAQSWNPSSVNHTIQVPSETTLIDRRFLWENQITLRLVGTPAVGEYLVNYGVKDAFGPFPMQQMCLTTNCTINSNTISQNTQDIISIILRLNNPRDLQRYNGMTPTAYDTYYKYSDAVNANNNPNGSWVNVSDNDLLPRGSYTLESISGNSIGDGNPKTVDVVIKVTEPILMSPFLFGEAKSNGQAMYGIQNMSFNFTLTNGGSTSRVWRTSSTLTSATVTSIEQPVLRVTFLSPHPSDLFPSRNVVAYYELPRYTLQLPAVVNAGATADLTSNNLQLNQIPDKVIIGARKKMTNQTWNDSDSWLPIEGTSINFNNQSGILSSADVHQLYQMSVANGSNQNWLEFRGKANVPFSGNTLPDVATSGSLLVLAFGKDIQLVNDYEAPGCIGNYNFQYKLTVRNNTGAEINSTTHEVITILLNSGLMVFDRGTSSKFTAILSKVDVLEASEQKPYFMDTIQRKVGSGFFDMLKSAASVLLPKLRESIRGSDNKLLGAVDKGLSKLGLGHSGGMGPSGGAGPSGGRMSLRDRIMNR